MVYCKKLEKLSAEIEDIITQHVIEKISSLKKKEYYFRKIRTRIENVQDKLLEIASVLKDMKKLSSGKQLYRELEDLKRSSDETPLQYKAKVFECLQKVWIYSKCVETNERYFCEMFDKNNQTNAPAGI